VATTASSQHPQNEIASLSRPSSTRFAEPSDRPRASPSTSATGRQPMRVWVVTEVGVALMGRICRLARCVRCMPINRPLSRSRVGVASLCCVCLQACRHVDTFIRLPRSIERSDMERSPVALSVLLSLPNHHHASLSQVRFPMCPHHLFFHNRRIPLQSLRTQDGLSSKDWSVMGCRSSGSRSSCR
jgi:hypothetical protein